MAKPKFPEFVRSTEYRRELGLKRKKAIRKMYSDIAKETEQKIRQIQNSGKVTGTTVLQLRQLRDLQKSVDDSLKNITAQIEKDIAADMKKVAAATCSSVGAYMQRYGVKVGMSLAHVPETAVKNLISGNVYGQRWTLNGAIWGDYKKASGDLAQIVAKGLAQNRPIYDIAKDLEKYVNPAVRKDYAWARQYPGSKKVVDYNAIRLAQTMSTHAHQQAVILSCKDDPMFDGVEWRSSGSNRVCPLCEQRNGEVFPFDKCPMDHPMGQCTLIPHIKGTMIDEKTGKVIEPDFHEENAKVDGNDLRRRFQAEKERLRAERAKNGNKDSVSINVPVEENALNTVNSAVNNLGNAVDNLQNAAQGLTSGGRGGTILTGRGSGVVKGSYPDNPAVEILGADTSNPAEFVVKYALDNDFRRSKIERMVYVRADGKAFVKDGYEYGIGTASIAKELKDAVTLHCHPDSEGMPGGSFSISPGDDLFDMFTQKTKMDYVTDSKHIYRMKIAWSKIKDEDELYDMLDIAREHFRSSHTIDYNYEDEKHEICKALAEVFPDIFTYEWR